MRLLEQPVEIGKRPVSRLDIAVVGDVVAEIGLGAREDRRQPDGVDAEARDVIELGDNARNIAEPVAIRIGKNCADRSGKRPRRATRDLKKS